MPTPDEEVGRTIGGRHSQKFSVAKGGMNVENKAVAKLNGEMTVLKKTIDAISRSFIAMKSAAAGAMAAARGATSTSGGFAQNGMPLAPPAPQSPVRGTMPTQGGGGGGQQPPGTAGGAAAGGGFGAMRGMMARLGVSHISPQAGVLIGTGVLAAGASQLTGAIDDRVNRGMDYALSADRLSVLMQQQFGMTQQQTMQQRQQMTRYRLGAGGVGSLMQFQTQTGVQATPQIASSIAAIRALGGYSKTTFDVLSDQRSLMDPQVANRMFNMLGINALGYGGKTRDPFEMRQSVINAMGLTNNAVLRSALTPGSITRARMADAGINESLQTEIIQQAQSNLAFTRRGGKGQYDPRNPEHRKLMGIEDNFATQVEQTETVRTQREEQFMERQIDNYAKLEKNTQQMVELLGRIEDKLSGPIGARTASRGWQRIGGRLMQLGGLGLMAAAPLTGGATLLPGAALTVAGSAAASGDPTDTDGSGGGNVSLAGSSSTARDAQIAVPVGYGGGKATLNEVKQRSDFRRLQPRMQERLLRMFRENPNVGIGGGFRDSSAQERMFRDRYRPTNKKTKTFWNGTYWEHVKGAAAAPPGRSMHEIGLAADLIGDIGWMNRNAGRFGLKHFAGVNNEPWHVQPSELPNSRREFEGQGASWASDDDGTTKVTTGTETPTDEHSLGYTGKGITGYAGMSISEILNSIANGTASFRGSSGTLRRSTKTTSSTTNAGTTAAGGTIPVSGVGAELAARAAFNVGIRGEDLYKIVAIAGRESGWNPGAMNPSTSDTGMWQINWKAHQKWLREKLGVKERGGLLNLTTNAKAMRFLYDESGFKGWKASASSSYLGGKPGWDPKGNEMWNTEKYQAAARVAVDKITGDPMPGMMGGENTGARQPSAIAVGGPTYQISVAPVIKFEGGSGGGVPTYADLKKIASDVGALLREEMRTLEMRNA